VIVTVKLRFFPQKQARTSSGQPAFPALIYPPAFYRCIKRPWSHVCIIPVNIKMIEKQVINGKQVWIKVDAHPVERNNPNIIPTEYFTAACYTDEPTTASSGSIIRDEQGAAKLFESPVAALTYAGKWLENTSVTETEDDRTARTQQEQKETD
jgi:hypothetical protein